jgi:hypothetical protein
MPAGQNNVRNLEAGVLLLGVGAVLLLVSLFLEWYQPNVDAWEIFEVWDLVLALLAVAALATLASRLGYGAARRDSHVVAPAVAALVIVLYALLDPPPLNSALGDGDPATGLWLALAATILMSLGALLSVARVSVAFNRAVAAPVGTPPGAVADPAQRGPFAPRAGVADPAITPDPVGPAGPADPAGSARASRRFLRGPADPVEPVPPTEPTRRI